MFEKQNPARPTRRRVCAPAWACVIGLCVLLASLPAWAQSSDPFQSAPVAPAAPKPRLQPRVRVEPDPAFTPPVATAPAPAPAPTLPPASAIWASVRQVAQAAGVNVPLASDPPFDTSGTPPQYRALLGGWGAGVWQGTPGGDKTMLIVLGVDGGGNVHGVVAHGLGTDWSYFTAPSTGNRFTVHNQITYAASGFSPTTKTAEDDYWQFELRPDGRLYGFRQANASTIVLPRVQ